MGVLVLVRHGQASFLADNYDRLSPLGEHQARLLGEYLARNEITFHRAYTGPLERQRRTAEIVGEVFAKAGLAWPEPETLEGLLELPAEALATRFFPRLAAEDPQVHRWMTTFQETHDLTEKARYFQRSFEILMAKWAHGEYGAEDIEPWETFAGRVDEALRAMTEGQPSGRRIIAFTSGGVTAAALQRALGTDRAVTLQLVWRLRNSALTQFLFTRGRFTLSSFNEAPHLPDPDLWTFR